MDVLILRLILDTSFFMAIFNPLISDNNPFMRYGLLAVLGAWLIWIVVNWKKKDLEGRVQDIALTQVKIMTVIQLYELVLNGFEEWQRICAPYVAVFIVTAILFLRAGRLIGGSQEKKKFWGSNVAELCLILGVAAVFSSEVVKGLAWALLGKFYMTLVFPVLMLFLNVFQAFLMFLAPIFSALFSGAEMPEFQVEVDNRTGQDFLQLTGNEALAETPLWVKAAGVAVVVLIFAVIFYFLYKKFAVAGSGRDRSIKGQVKKSTIGVNERRTTKKPSLFDEKNVRYYYRKFLMLCRKEGLEPEFGTVTTEIMRRIAVENWGEEESADEFTSLYRDVRYGGLKDGEPERKTAKALYKKMKGSAESKKTV